MNYTSLYHAYEIVSSPYLSFHLHLSLSFYLTNICYARLQLHRRPPLPGVTVARFKI